MTLEQALAAYRDVRANPEVQRYVGAVLWLSSVNAGFWILARVGNLLDLFSELFWVDLWDFFAIVYNSALAMFFAAVMLASAANVSPPSDLLWRECCGFIILYLSLSSSYLNPRTFELDEHTRPGFALGMLSYLIFAVKPKLVLGQPKLLDLISLLKDLSDSWLGKALTVFVAVGLAIRFARFGMRALLIGLQPLMWSLGLSKLPPIRVRNRR